MFGAWEGEPFSLAENRVAWEGLLRVCVNHTVDSRPRGNDRRM